MTVTARNPGYRIVGSEYGGVHDGTAKGARLFGEPGERCHFPGCSALLSDYNPGDRCYCHGPCGGVHKRKPRKRGEVASAGGTAVTNAAPPPRRVTTEEVEMAAKERRDRAARVEAIRAVLADGKWHSGRECSVAAGADYDYATKTLRLLVENGEVVSAGKGGKGYRLRDDVAAKARCDKAANNNGAEVTSEPDAASSVVEKSATDAPAGPAGAAPATTELDPEPPADPAPPAPLSVQQEEPAAGSLAYYNGLRSDWYDGKVEIDVDVLFAFATRMRDELLGKLTRIVQCHFYRLPVVARDVATGEDGVHWIDGLNAAEVSAVIHDSEAPGVYESVDWKGGSPEPPAAGPPPFAGVELIEPGPMTVDWFAPLAGSFTASAMSAELCILDKIEQLDDEARHRVLTYAVARWFCP